jgi:hypothetical protein
MRIIVIPDVQAKPGDDLAFLGWVGRHIAKEKPDVIVNIGDFADMPSLCSYDVGKKSFEGRSYKADIEAAREGMSVLLAPILQKRVELEEGHRKRWNPRMVLTLGNHEHRIDRAVEFDRKLEGLISINDLKYEEFGWEVIPFLTPIKIEGIMFAHYICSGVMGRPVTSAKLLLQKTHMSTIVGHQQGREIAFATKADNTMITGIIAGSCYQADQSYLNHQTNNHWKGIIQLDNVNDGAFDEHFISLNTLRKKYG